MLKCIGINCLISTKNIRSTEDEDIRSLAENIKMVGLLQPLTVMESSVEGKYAIVSGHRRYEALKLIDETIVECLVVDNIESERDLIRAQLSENIHRKDITPFEYVRIFETLKKEYGLSNNAIAMYLNKSIGWVNDQYTAVDILKRGYGDEENIPVDIRTKSASTIKRYHYSGKPKEKTKYDNDNLTCEIKRHIYKISCKDVDFENKLREFLKENGIDL